MEDLKLDIIRRKRLDRSAFLYGIIATFLLVGGAYQYITMSKIPFIEELARQLGVTDSLSIITVSFFVIGTLVSIRGLMTLLRTKRELGGSLTLTKDHLEIKKGKQAFHLTGEDLQELQFDIHPPSKKQAPLSGGNWVRIPSPKGTYRCEFDMCDQPTFIALKDYINHFETTHQVQINLNESENF